MKLACGCGAKLSLPEDTEAKRVLCPRCKQPVQTASSTPASAVAPRNEVDKDLTWDPGLETGSPVPIAFPPVDSSLDPFFPEIDTDAKKSASIGSPVRTDIWPAPWLRRRLVFAAGAWDAVAMVGLFFSMAFVLGGLATLLVAISRGDRVQGLSVAGGLFVVALGCFFSALPFRTLSSVLYLLAGPPR